MSDLTVALQNQGYDLIDGPTREHRILQIWLKRFGNSMVAEYSGIKKAFVNSTIALDTTKSAGLDVVSNSSKSLQFKIGISVLEDLLSKNNLGKLDLDTKITNGDSVVISYSDAYAETVEVGDLRRYFEGADLQVASSNFLKDLNKDNFHIISGIIYAKNLKAEIISKSDINASLDAEITKIVSGQVGVTRESNRKITLTAPLSDTFPIAVRCHRINYKHGSFRDLTLVSDTKDLFN